MECTKLNCPMQAGTVTENCGDNCPWRTTAKVDDLISRAAALEVIEAVKNVSWSQSGKVLCGKMYSQIKDFPAVEAVPVVHARWINYPECIGYDGAYTEEHIVCSACHSVWNIIDNDTDGFDYCPNCGAKMDGERRDSE